MSELQPQPDQNKKKCCEQSFLGSLVGLNKPERGPVGPLRKTLGLFLLAGVHFHLIAWSALYSLIRPRYRPVVKFQVRYFKDIMADALKKPPPAT